MRRADILITSWEGGGNVPPALALAERLVARGHRVRISGQETMRRRVEATGAELAAHRTVPDYPRDVVLETIWDQVDAVINGPRMVDELIDDLRADRPDLVLLDSMHGAGMAAAEAVGVPRMVFAHTTYRRWVSWIGRIIDLPASRRAARLEPVPEARFVEDVLGPMDGVLALIPASFDDPGPIPAATRYVGPILTRAEARAVRRGFDRPAGAQPGGERSVLISFGTTIQRQAEALRPVLRAFADLGRVSTGRGDAPVRGVLTLGGVVRPGLIEAPSTVEVLDLVPHAPIFPTVDAVVCHGGLSTIMGALAAGRPLVVVPQGRDQDDNATMVEAAGAGIALPVDAGPPAIAAAVRAVLGDPSHRRAAQRFAREIDALGHGRLAIELVEAAVQADSRLGRTGERAATSIGARSTASIERPAIVDVAAPG